ncbi:hypothetical protein PoB_001031300 [Plakobranchus ocellatus]|uniref:Uncharacterized protein n=1 Tax=Plakobranchus ocellatus TaxID=259542 RepID=A0AAV3YMN0_9GAST|nr:hypothetical protein PoB_001031300 [Plakobranchus ocellatus]
MICQQAFSTSIGDQQSRSRWLLGNWSVNKPSVLNKLTKIEIWAFTPEVVCQQACSAKKVTNNRDLGVHSSVMICQQVFNTSIGNQQSRSGLLLGI